MFDLNPIDVLKQRKLTIALSHFKKIAITEIDLFNGLENWINTKLHGRYYIAKQPGIDDKGNLRSTYFVGFEDQKELTYFILACPILRRT